MPAEHAAVSGLEAFLTKAKELTANKKSVYGLFCGSKDANGKSWCPDCVKAEPVIEKAFAEATDDVVLVHCDVGKREYWKDPKCPFRTHDVLKLSAVPTLLKWSAPEQRLVEEKCLDSNLVKMLLEE